MALADHLRELRARLLKIAVVLLVGTIAAFFFYDELLALIKAPYDAGIKDLEARDIESEAVVNGVATPFLLQLKVSGLAAVVVTSPLWLYQIWAFIVPGLHPHEKKWTKIFAVLAGPLFVAGVAVAYYVLPKGIEVLLGFTPAGVTSLVEFSDYFRFFTRMMLVFGIAFEIPLFVVMLSLAGVVTGKALGSHRPWIVLGTFVFAAIATPSTDPFSMLMLAVPMVLLFLASEVVARLIDRRRAKHAGEDFSQLADDEQSPLDYRRDPDDYRRSGLGREDD
jgi:sec-independent protein translocase protein TatC